ncbi:hypothetical protein OXPF_18290 [Oxobacter pfennigii]|uniref:DUF2809 domain-containing protein n=1 Tax=Oxobacter pfennigii TaxID=36849 RepID=A0A0P8WQC3_9CLOT|nr:DUF2809 domain-containing protein [Oxobacter pfennigii]KPU44743.1 hypothetical protein OXPF_18290 [Oxobacter pfennigii]
MIKNFKYILAFLILLMIEVIIALFVKDNFIRPYAGDILVVILMYTFIKGIVKKPIHFLPIYLFIFSALIEAAQYFRIVDILGLRDNKLISTIMGTSFDIKDIMCYLAAAVILILWEAYEKNLILKSSRNT